MPYVAEPPTTVPSADELRARIPGWGVDLDPADRPSGTRLLPPDPARAGARWYEPEPQPDPGGRERSIEHARLTPVFGTSCPLHGPSGALRRYAYARFSEARAAHWLLLLAADRVDATGQHLRSLATLRPDNPLTQTGVLSEARRHGLRSRLGQRRADVGLQAMDPVLVAGPWLVAGAATVLAGRGLARRARRVRRRPGA